MTTRCFKRACMSGKTLKIKLKAKIKNVEAGEKQMYVCLFTDTHIHANFRIIK